MLTYENSPAGTPLTRRLALLLALAITALIVRRGWMSDDAFITLRTVDNFVHGHGLVWNVGSRVQTYTHPAWTMLLVAVYAATREPFYTTITLSVVTSLLALLVLFRRVARTELHAALAFVVLATSSSFVDYSTSGLENPLAHLLLVLFAAEASRPQARAVRLALIAGLLPLTRHDLLVLIGPALVGVLWEARRRGADRRLLLRTLGAFVAPIGLWTLFSLVYYGAPFPNTAYAKLFAGIPAREVRLHGLGYLISTLLADPLTLVAIAFGAGCGLFSRAPWQRGLGLGALLYVAYCVEVGGDFMLGRFFTAPLVAAVVLLARAELREPRRLASALLVPLACVGFYGLVTRTPPVGDGQDERGVADERWHYLDGMSLESDSASRIMPDFVLAREGRLLGAEAPARLTLRGTHTAGLVGYYGGPRYHFFDWFGLSDPVLARLPAIRERRWRAGHLLRVVVPGYERTWQAILDGDLHACHVDDPALCALIADVALVTRGPLFGGARWAAIGRMLVGHHRRAIELDRYRHPRLERVAGDDVTTSLPAGTAWSDPRVHRFVDDGLDVRFPRVVHPRAIELTIDHDDCQTLSFFRGAELVGTRALGARGGEGLALHRFRLAAELREEGFDRIRFEPICGDGRNALGHLRVR